MELPNAVVHMLKKEKGYDALQGCEWKKDEKIKESNSFVKSSLLSP